MRAKIDAFFSSLTASSQSAAPNAETANGICGPTSQVPVEGSKTSTVLTLLSWVNPPMA
eukprot:CAMPEP_0180694292 /NCGR_PEP_ID=MMETSP1038_2-20121128/1826_1 /TAXON_ID=632150 /ORGANISM="Azadinium spinosum, Strain 3D9" /LENGTH=58 /DNA_ID=CAMNT_0022725611 /DNA_START=402 /DNA_END=578 /DNA_ORIENTATION=+